jgi:hypothetical protein
VRDLSTTPGESLVVNDTLLELRLSESHPDAAAMVQCLIRLWQTPSSFVG